MNWSKNSMDDNFVFQWPCCKSTTYVAIERIVHYPNGEVMPEGYTCPCCQAHHVHCPALVSLESLSEVNRGKA